MHSFYDRVTRTMPNKRGPYQHEPTLSSPQPRRPIATVTLGAKKLKYYTFLGLHWACIGGAGIAHSTGGRGGSILFPLWLGGSLGMTLPLRLVLLPDPDSLIIARNKHSYERGGKKRERSNKEVRTHHPATISPSHQSLQNFGLPAISGHRQLWHATACTLA